MGTNLDTRLSVVVPVYRVEQTLDRCVESIAAQGVGGMEIILIDDGSPDGCPALCDRWAERDARVRVLHKANGGLSDARNAGIEAAKGMYITFADSDDFIAPGTYRQLLATLDAQPQCDILEYPMERQMPNGRLHRLALANRAYSSAADYWTLTQAYLHTYAWNKVYRRELFADIHFPKGQLFEDALTFPKLLKKAKTISTTSQGTYHYTYNPQGITANADGNALRTLLKAHLNSGFPLDDNLYYMHVLNIQLDVFMATGDEPLLPQRLIGRTRGMGASMKLKAAMLNLLGMKTLCKTIKTLHKARKPRS